MLKMIKMTDLDLKDFEESKGIVAFYFASFNNKDSDGDIIMPGTYAKSIKENKDRIKHFKNHDFTKVPGVITDLGEDKVGAFAVSQLMKTTVGKDTLVEYQNKAITEHSHGFSTIHEEFSEEQDANIISEAQLWEVSSLTAWGANKETPMIDLKGEKDILLYVKHIEGILRKGNVSEARLLKLDTQLTKLCDLMVSLKAGNQPSKKRGTGKSGKPRSKNAGSGKELEKLLNQINI